jgi:hypothetical protein
MFPTGTFSLRSCLRTATFLLLIVLIAALGTLAIVQPERYLFVFASKGVFYFVWFFGVVLLYYLLREERG